jgi:hypothetical protein
MTSGTLAHVSTLLMAVGIPSMPRSTGYGGRCRGSPTFPSMDRISAVSSPQTNAPAPLTSSMSKENPVPRMSSPRAPGPAPAAGDQQVLDGQRILGPDVDHALGGARGERADDHPLQDAVGIALQQAPVHVRARVALVRVADQESRAPARSAGQHLPLEARREPGAAPAAEPGGLHLSMTRPGRPAPGPWPARVAPFPDVVDDPDGSARSFRDSRFRVWWRKKGMSAWRRIRRPVASST